MKTQTKQLTFLEIWEILRKKFPNLSRHSLRREIVAFPERLGAVRRNPTKRYGRGGAYLFDPEKVRAYNPYQPLKKQP